MGLFGNTSLVTAPPLLGTLVSKKRRSLFCILVPQEHFGSSQNIYFLVTILALVLGQFGTRTIWHRGHFGTWTIWHRRQFGTVDNLTLQTIWHQTIWHCGLFDIMCQNGQLDIAGNLTPQNFLCYRVSLKKIGSKKSLVPKGAQTPSNCHISPECWQNISNTNIYIFT